MGDIFLKVLNMSITAGWLVPVILLIRFLLRRMPKWGCCLLWGLVAVRLIVPFSIESTWSLQPSAEPIRYALDADGKGTVYVPMIDSHSAFVADRVNPALKDAFAYQEADSVAPMQVITEIAGAIWLMGMILLTGFAIVSTVRLYLLVREAVRYQDCIYLCDAVTTPFILGIVKPRIYLPSTLQEEEMTYILAHERAHLQRRDHLWKTIGYLLLCVYWFHPLLILAYHFLCKDIEMACDEMVIRDMSFADKKEYSRILLSCASHRRLMLICPLAFGEVGVRDRVKAVLNHKKTAVSATVLAIFVCIMIGVCFLTDPVKKTQNQASQEMETPAREPNADSASIYDELDRVVSAVGLDNSYSWDHTVDLGATADALVKLASDASGRYEIYGIKSEKYGTYGLLLNDWIGGEQNWNYALVPWCDAGTPDARPMLEPDENGAYIFSYVYQYADGVPMRHEYVLDCGYDTGHMELLTEKDYYGESEESAEPAVRKHDDEFYEMVKESRFGSALDFMSMYLKMFKERDAAGIAVLSEKAYSESEQENFDSADNEWMSGATAEFFEEKADGGFTMIITSDDGSVVRFVDVAVKRDEKNSQTYYAAGDIRGL